MADQKTRAVVLCVIGGHGKVNNPPDFCVTKITPLYTRGAFGGIHCVVRCRGRRPRRPVFGTVKTVPYGVIRHAVRDWRVTKGCPYGVISYVVRDRRREQKPKDSALPNPNEVRFANFTRPTV